MVNVLITGSQGFIGSYVCAELLNNGYNVIGVDNYSKYGKVVRSHDNHPSFSLIVGDVLDVLCINNIDRFKNTDYIISLAAMIGGISYFHKYAYDLLATNERISATTFDLAIKLFQGHKFNRIMSLSSSMVFESTSVYPTPETEITKCPPPLSTYGFQKLATEYFCRGAYEQYGLPYTIIRPFNCVGVGEKESLSKDVMCVGNTKMLMSHVLPDFVDRALRLSDFDEFPILGSGNQVRHYTNGKDLAFGIRLALESDKAINEDFNLSHSRPVSVKELANIVWSKTHTTTLKIKNLPAFEYDVQYRSPDVSKAKKILGFDAKIDIEESVDEVIAWMSMGEWYERNN